MEPSCSYWWANLLYIQNLYPGNAYQCMGWAWYLAVDMQLYIIAPLLIIPLVKSPKLGVAINIFAILATSLVTFGIAYYYNVGRSMVLFEFDANLTAESKH